MSMTREPADREAYWRENVRLDAQNAELRAENERLQDKLVLAVKQIDAVQAANERLRTLLHEARQYVSDAGNDEDGETQTLSAALLTEIDKP